MNNIPDTKDIVQKLSNSLIHSGWQSILRMFLISSDMTSIIDQLKEKREKVGPFVPGIVECLEWLRKCPSHNVKVIIMIDIKNNLYGLTTGIPLSKNKPGNPGPVLKKMFMDMYDGNIEDKSCDLTRWCQQGVLIIPYSPTWTIKGNGHHKIWEKFLQYLLNKINEQYSEVPVIYIGKSALQYKTMMKSPYQYEIRIGWKKIFHDDVWNKINQILQQQQYKLKIVW